MEGGSWVAVFLESAPVSCHVSLAPSLNDICPRHLSLPAYLAGTRTSGSSYLLAWAAHPHQTLHPWTSFSIVTQAQRSCPHI